MAAHFRIARPVSDLTRTEVMYRRGLGMERLGHFEDHEGFDGVMIGEPGGDHHFEFTYCRTHPVKPTPTPEDLLVFYVPDREEWSRRCASMLAAGFTTVASLNPYWDKAGRTFEDHDGYRVVVQCASWVSRREGSAK
jgi:catechol 2,3-dioxygenase-like lactoylglutathione lyase family enzyme